DRHTPSARSWARASDLTPERRGETDVALDHVAHVAHVVRKHQCSFDSQSEGPAAVDLRVDPRGHEHTRVDHTTAADLDPPLAGAGAARGIRVAHGGATADEALHVHLGRGFGEGKVGGSKTGLQPFPEEGSHEGVDSTAQM